MEGRARGKTVSGGSQSISESSLTPGVITPPDINTSSQGRDWRHRKGYLKKALWKWPGSVALGTKSWCVGNKDESVAQIVPSSPANSQALSLLPPFPFFLSLTPPSKCNLASLKVHIVPPSKEFYYRCSKEKKMHMDLCVLKLNWTIWHLFRRQKLHWRG